LAAFSVILAIGEVVTVGVGVGVAGIVGVGVGVVVAVDVGVGLTTGLLVTAQVLTEAPSDEVKTNALNLVLILALTPIDLLLLEFIVTL
jgi:hypothetical protein